MVRTGWSAEKPFESQLGKSFEKWGQWARQASSTSARHAFPDAVKRILGKRPNNI
jgi:hypothetical protein